MHVLFISIVIIGQFTGKFCEATIRSLHNKGVRNQESNYRGISWLGFMDSLFTMVLNNQLVDWAELHHKLDEGPAGYRRYRSIWNDAFTV